MGLQRGTQLPSIRRMGKGLGRRVTPKQHFPFGCDRAGGGGGGTYHCGLALNLKTSLANPSANARLMV